MIVDRALMREVTYTGTGVALVIVGVFLVVRLVRLLAAAAAGELPVDAIVMLLGLKMVSYMDVILPVIFYIAILMVMGRWIKDNEMTVLAACGVGLGRLLRPVLALVVVVSVTVGLFSMFLAPLADRNEQTIIEESKRQSQVSGVTPGVFNEVKGGKGVYYVEQLGFNENAVVNVFAYGQSFKREGVVMAKSGYQYVDEQTGDRFLVLKNGTRYEGVPGEAGYRIMEFESYALRVAVKPVVVPSLPVQALPTIELMGADDRRKIAELQWRISKPLTVPVLAILALSFSYLEVRKSLLPRILVGFAAYFLYTNLLGFGQGLMKKGKLDPAIGLWWIHALFLVIAVLMFMRTARNKPLWPSLSLPWLRLRPWRRGG